MADATRSSMTDRSTRRPFRPGFTMVELMAVVAVLAILAMIAIPGFQDRLAREQIIETVRWASFVTNPISEGWLKGIALPADNVAAGLPMADQVVGNHVRSLSIDGGSVQIVFGNHAMSALTGKTLSLRPAIPAAAASMPLPISWLCAHSAPPGGMLVYGPDRTDIDPRFLPLNCR